MAFKGITFAGQNVTPKNDGGLYNAHYGDGILSGCSMAISGDELVIQSGQFIACGRVCQVDGATSVDLSGRTITTGYIQVIMNYDLSQSEGSQWYTTFVESATTTFPALTQDDINGTGTLYQLELAIIQISGGNLTSINSSCGLSLVNSSAFVVNPENTNGEGVLGKDTNATYMYQGQNGTPASGIWFNQNGSAVLYGNNNAISLRPNGLNSTTGQVYVDAGGQINGGYTTKSDSSGTTRTTVTGWNNIHTVSLEKGMWLCTGVVFFNIPANTGVLSYLQFLPASASDRLRERHPYSNYATSVQSCRDSITRMIEIPSTTNTSFQVDLGASFTITWSSIYCVRIG